MADELRGNGRCEYWTRHRNTTTSTVGDERMEIGIGVTKMNEIKGINDGIR